MNELKIWYKKSPVKLGKNKTLLFEVKSSWNKDSIFFFTDRSKYIQIKNDPSIVLEILRTVGGLSETVDKALFTSAKISVISKGIVMNKTSLIPIGGL